MKERRGRERRGREKGEGERARRELEIGDREEVRA